MDLPPISAERIEIKSLSIDTSISFPNEIIFPAKNKDLAVNRLILKQPTSEMKDEIWRYREAFLENHDSCDGSSGLNEFSSFEEWLDTVLKNWEKETVLPNRVPAFTYVAVRKSDQKIVGMIQIRHTLNDYLFNFGGNIGYSVLPSERRQGFAKEMLQLGLKVAHDLGLKRVLITCSSNNVASEKTILSGGGILENVVQAGKREVKRFWIEV
jgi:predicted acetyltransferase